MLEGATVGRGGGCEVVQVSVQFMEGCLGVMGSVLSGHSVCSAMVLRGGPGSEELAFSGKVGSAVVGFPLCPCLVVAWQGFPVVGGTGEIIGGQDIVEVIAKSWSCTVPL